MKTPIHLLVLVATLAATSVLTAAPRPATAQGELFVRTMQLTPQELQERTRRPQDTTALEIQLAGEVLRTGNQKRLAAGLQPLQNDPLLARAAERYSRKMRDGRFFAHVSPDGETLAERLPEGEGWRYEKLGENLWSAQGALDWRAVAIAAQATDDWILSPSHRDNLLESIYTHGGVGVAVDGDKVYVTQLYAKPYDDPVIAQLRRQYSEPPADMTGFARNLESSVLSAINRARSEAGLTALFLDSGLANEARNHVVQPNSDANGEAALRRVLARRSSGPTRVTLASWGAQGDLTWEGTTLAESALESWKTRPQTASDLMDPTLDQAGIGVHAIGDSVRISVMLGQSPLRAATIRRPAGSRTMTIEGAAPMPLTGNYIAIE